MRRRIISQERVRRRAYAPRLVEGRLVKRMTVLFEDEDLYTAVKIEAARRSQPLKELVTAALREWLEMQEDAESRVGIESARAEWKDQGGIEAREFFDRLKQQTE